jgi:hypothetical protein
MGLLAVPVSVFCMVTRLFVLAAGMMIGRLAMMMRGRFVMTGRFVVRRPPCFAVLTADRLVELAAVLGCFASVLHAFSYVLAAMCKSGVPSAHVLKTMRVTCCARSS